MTAGNAPLCSAQKAMDLAVLGTEEGTTRILLHPAQLYPECLDLKTGSAGNMLCKCDTHPGEVMVVLTIAQVGSGRCAEMSMEPNHFQIFGFGYARQAAEPWLHR